MDIVPRDVSSVELRDEVNTRTHRAGYTTKDGGPIMPKIRSYRYSSQGRDNYDKIFKHS